MKRLRLPGLVLIAVFALGAVAASASATERGVLLLEKETGNVEFTGTSTAGLKITFTLGKSTFTCTGLSLLKAILSEPGPTHFNLGKNAELHISGCKTGATSCSTENTKGEKDPNEVFLILADLHFVNLLNEAKELQPGLAHVILGTPSDGGAEVLKVSCGVVLKIELKGTFIGLVTPLFEEKVTLVKDVTDLDLHFVSAGEKCDKENEKVCEELLKNKPLLAKVKATFEPLTIETTLFLITSNKMILVDD